MDTDTNTTNTNIWPQHLNTYIGNKGYTIFKSELTIKQQLKLKELLMVKPFVPGSPIQVQKTYPVYRESDKKIYVPRYFGESIFGPAKMNKITEGDNITLEFKGDLREKQVPVVDKYLSCVNAGGSGLLELPCGFGKCLGKSTKVLMYDGHFELVENIKVGDVLMGDDSTPRNVLSLARGREQMYKISSDKGDEYICNESHILSLKYLTNTTDVSVIDMSVTDYLTLQKLSPNPKKHKIPLLGYKVGISFKEQRVEFDPYLAGYLLGKETRTTISINNTCIVSYIDGLFKLKYPYLYLSYLSENNYKINSLNVLNNQTNAFETFLDNNLLNCECDCDCVHKHIPNHYKHNSRKIRLKLLAGIIDSIGLVKTEPTNIYEIVHTNHTFTEDIVYLCQSLGIACYNIPFEKNGVEYNNLQIYGDGLEEIPVLDPKNHVVVSKNIKNSLVYRLIITKLKVDDYYGFEIDGNKRFILGGFIVTHNTSIGLHLISRIQKKTLVIVHKEFLMNQWIERIAQFLPNARIGKIQGQIIDTDNKDIVIAMLQSLSMKDYPSSLFDSFGFTIIDEVHHISSEVFSCALFKLVTKYMLGLSATMNRKDGTTKVFKMFLGEVVFKQERDKDDHVIVRGITYKSNDEEFNEVELDFRGQTAASKMLSKICTYNHRTEFIIKVLKDMIAENPKQQIMMISSYKNILSYMFDAINHHGICSVGYYVGGMKEAALKVSESKQVILATYSMAAEGLDIKSLTTLFMITPMTNIEQSVGRILRQKHDFAPVVVDIIDTHSNFQRQWAKRKSFYKKQNYKIIETNSVKYTTDVSKWNVVHKPFACTEDINEDNNNNDDDDNNDNKPAGVCLLKIKKNKSN